VSTITSQNLENDGDMSRELEVIDLAVSRPNEYIGYNSFGSFIGLKLEWASTSKVEYKGADLYGRKTE